MAAGDSQGAPADAPTRWLNETLFIGYHRFASTMRVISPIRRRSENKFPAFVRVQVYFFAFSGLGMKYPRRAVKSRPWRSSFTFKRW